MSKMNICSWGMNVSFIYGESPSGVKVEIAGRACFEPAADGAGACARIRFHAKITAHDARLESIFFAKHPEPGGPQYFPTEEGFQMDDPRVLPWIERGLDPCFELFRSDASWAGSIAADAPMLAAQYERLLLSADSWTVREAPRTALLQAL